MPRGIKNVPVSKDKTKEGKALGKNTQNANPTEKTALKSKGIQKPKSKNKKDLLLPAFDIIASMGMEMVDDAQLSKELHVHNMPTDLSKLVEYAIKKPVEISSISASIHEKIFYYVLADFIKKEIVKFKSKINVCVQKVTDDSLVYYVVKKKNDDFDTPLKLISVLREMEKRTKRPDLNLFFLNADIDQIGKIKDGQRII